MTPANNGAGTPENDDPFGYLYEDGQAAGATPPNSGGYGYPGPAAGGAAQPGVPRTSYNHVRTVGDRQYGGARPQVPPQAQYQAPEALRAEGYGPTAATQYQPHPDSGSGGHGGGRGRGPNTKGLLIGAVAVVAAVVIGIGIALASGDDDPKGAPQAGNAGGNNAAPQDPSPQPSESEEKPAELPKTDATGPGLVLAGGAAAETTVPGAKAAGGSYVGGFNQVGASVTWTVDVPEAGTYRVYLRYGTPGEDANATLTANGKPNTSPLNLKNFGNTPKGDWEKGWKTTWGQVNLNKGTNTIKVSCEQGNQCNAAIDQLWITGVNG
ncbi:CBM35 domain-containing protein [Streptomyces sp. NPDC051219]|uniref:CBM35 domain-containing protein n=1 Tax=Streptomyces sp. NPDC051219 TaxID=3155283 RepID=UPI003413178F